MCTPSLGTGFNKYTTRYVNETDKERTYDTREMDIWETKWKLVWL